ncbi:hypothetical protein C483_17123 [Natrialba hulunbeirensis JCM 10989]|uniref:Glycolipid-binding domain-containing protein n=1 Tax=Natrialba hulunbeirensis JCM 10989 TaxID=1227493 RepID=L9ZQ10_9EURY|nr:putative glycolipid-binding domain-containing protein [Natrialba hulunbeirensis]ELY87642.1 hypothetical protein C483_17123 [Natrialba hulunbeirensis JCM 10989]
MNRDVFWIPAAGIGIESLHLREDSSAVNAESVVVGVADGESFRVRYEVDCDHHYRVQRVEIATLGRESESLSLQADGEGTWTDARGEAVAKLDGCTDVDISVTPFTNTVPIRRLELDRSESAEIGTVYIGVPELRVETARQRYTCLDPLDENGGRYRYESLSSGFTAELPVDSDGLVTTYPELFEQVSPTDRSRRSSHE